MNGSKSNDIYAIYEDMVARKEIVFDSCQVALLRELVKYTNGSHKWWKFWQKRAALPKKKGVYLYGDVGRGKSLLASVFYDHCGIERKKKLHFNTLMKQLHDLLHKARLDSLQNMDHLVSSMDELIGDVSLLYLDEMQVRDICEAVMLHRVFKVLFSRKLIILMTSNYHPRKLYEDGVQKELFIPAIDLIEENMEVIALSGEKDYRVEKCSASRCKFYVGAGADQQLRDHFLNFINCQKTEKAVFVLGNNRSIYLGEASKDVIWFSFDELCGSKNPLWASDYKKIAQSYSYIFIEGIPIFDYYSQNEMHRFIVLIDELYEHKSRLFCSLACQVSELYAGVPAVDIKRAMSRLSEMGSAAW
ncbi:cell division protein ZapE [Anaplasma phagocytophilum]|uniref:AFG1-like ATPase family protein n=1 Tax=Anaplasma phagocytophilum str. ApNP TaxID=1359153 RepID=A0A0F3NHD8_ANAPH|nr:AFG1-like ATPase family protein [Anaplasma phagocytophilum str. ApNP]